MQNKVELLRTAGIGCGSHCTCLSVLAAMLSDDQVATVCSPDFREMQESGALDLIEHMRAKRELHEGGGDEMVASFGFGILAVMALRMQDGEREEADVSGDDGLGFEELDADQIHPQRIQV